MIPELIGMALLALLFLTPPERKKPSRIEWVLPEDGAASPTSTAAPSPSLDAAL